MKLLTKEDKIEELRKVAGAAAKVHKYLFERGDKWPHELCDAAFEVWYQLERELTRREKKAQHVS